MLLPPAESDVLDPLPPLLFFPFYLSVFLHPDGGIVNGDGCDANCQVEAGFVCTGGSKTTPDSCAAGELLASESFASPWSISTIGEGGAIETGKAYAYEVWHCLIVYWWQALF